MALPFGTAHYNPSGKKTERTRSTERHYTSTQAIRISADDARWFMEQQGPKESTHTVFHRLRMMLAKAENENKDLRKRCEELHRQNQLLHYQVAQNLLDHVENRPMDELDKEIKEGKLMF